MAEKETEAGERCDVCGEVVTDLYPAEPHQPQIVDFTRHNREAYERHLVIVGESR